MRITGTHTGADTTIQGWSLVLTDSTKHWTTNQWVGYSVIRTSDSNSRLSR